MLGPDGPDGCAVRAVKPIIGHPRGARLGGGGLGYIDVGRGERSHGTEPLSLYYCG